jgi:sterol desaturase/sphingolipid hydroxylase (fatty acid hydroxylase superfamily)
MDILKSHFTNILLIALIFIPLERILTLRREQNLFRKFWQLDFVYLLINFLPITIGLNLIIFAVLLLSPYLVPLDFRQWVASNPLWLQVPAAIIVSDLGFYAVHRLFHKVPALWKFHAVHHSIESLDWLAAHRVHPIDQICTKGASFIGIFALGFSPEAVAIYGIIYQWQSLLIHANTTIGFGPLEHLVASPHFHHWHHADHREAWDKNFAGQLSIIDRLFGTLHLPDAMPEKYGTSEPVPESYQGQLAYPVKAIIKQRKPEPT